MRNNELDDLITNDIYLELNGGVIHMPTKRDKPGVIGDYYKPNRTILDMLRVMTFLNQYNVNLCCIETPALIRIIRKCILKKASRAWAKNLSLLLFDIRDYNMKGELFNLPQSVSENIKEIGM